MVVGAGGEAPPEAGPVAVVGDVGQAGEDESTGLVGVLAGDEVGEVPVGVEAEQGPGMTALRPHQARSTSGVRSVSGAVHAVSI